MLNNDELKLFTRNLWIIHYILINILDKTWDEQCIIKLLINIAKLKLFTYNVINHQCTNLYIKPINNSNTKHTITLL